MARPSDPKKLALWQDRFLRFSSSDLAVARFCAIEQVSVASFYLWRKKVGRQSARQTGREAPRETGRQTDREIGRPLSCEVGNAPDDKALPAFQPVTVVPSVCGVSVRLPGGTLIEIGAAHLDAIRAVVAETVRIDRSWAVCDPSINRNVPCDNQGSRNRGDAPCSCGDAACTHDGTVRNRSGIIRNPSGIMRNRGGASC